MKKKKQLTIRMNEDLYLAAQRKCDQKFGIGLSPLIKMFLYSFVSQKGVGFYIGDQDLGKLVNQWLGKKSIEKFQESRDNSFGPLLKDVYELGHQKNVWKF